MSANLGNKAPQKASPQAKKFDHWVFNKDFKGSAAIPAPGSMRGFIKAWPALASPEPTELIGVTAEQKKLALAQKVEQGPFSQFAFFDDEKKALEALKVHKIKSFPNSHMFADQAKYQKSIGRR